MSRIPLTMPKMSMTMEVGTIVAWEVAEGAQVKSGDVLEPRTASVAFFRVIDVKSGAAVITIKAASDSCDLAHPGDQAALCATIAERLDAAVKGPAGWFR